VYPSLPLYAAHELLHGPQIELIDQNREVIRGIQQISQILPSFDSLSQVYHGFRGGYCFLLAADLVVIDSHPRFLSKVGATALGAVLCRIKQMFLAKLESFPSSWAKAL
jgi:hypothetical protein